MISIKDYAASRNISYEAARKSLRRYEKELAGHLMKQGKSTVLDDEAVSFLDTKRMVSASAVQDIARQMSSSGEVIKLTSENQELQKEIHRLTAQLQNVQNHAGTQTDIELIAENKVLSSKVADLTARLKAQEEKNVELEADRIEMMDNDWQYIGDGDLLNDGGFLVRHHFNAFERFENPCIAYVYDVFAVEQLNSVQDSVIASLTKIDVADVDRPSWISKEKLLKKIGASAEDVRPAVEMMPGSLWAKEIVELYGPIQCRGIAYNNERATIQNIQISKEEARQWLEGIGADRFVAKNAPSSNAILEHSIKTGIQSSENAKHNRVLRSSDVVMSF